MNRREVVEIHDGDRGAEFWWVFGTRGKKKKRDFVDGREGSSQFLFLSFTASSFIRAPSDTEAVCAKQWLSVSDTAWVGLTREDRSKLSSPVREGGETVERPINRSQVSAKKGAVVRRRSRKGDPAGPKVDSRTVPHHSQPILLSTLEWDPSVSKFLTHTFRRRIHDLPHS